VEHIVTWTTRLRQLASKRCRHHHHHHHHHRRRRRRRRDAIPLCRQPRGRLRAPGLLASTLRPLATSARIARGTYPRTGGRMRRPGCLPSSAAQTRARPSANARREKGSYRCDDTGCICMPKRESERVCTRACCALPDYLLKASRETPRALLDAQTSSTTKSFLEECANSVITLYLANLMLGQMRERLTLRQSDGFLNATVIARLTSPLRN